MLYVWLRQDSKWDTGNSVGAWIQKNTDKLLVLFVMIMFYVGAWYAYKFMDPNLGNASIDLVKQLVASFLTLTVGSRLMQRGSDNGGTNGTSNSGNSSASSNASTTSGVH